jgi:hypothetical protein
MSGAAWTSASFRHRHPPGGVGGGCLCHHGLSMDEAAKWDTSDSLVDCHLLRVWPQDWSAPRVAHERVRGLLASAALNTPDSCRRLASVGEAPAVPLVHVHMCGANAECHAHVQT